MRLPQIRLLVIKRLLLSCILIFIALLVLSPFARHSPAPTATPAPPPLQGMRVMIDPGHGGVDGGCCQGDVLEKDINLAAGLALRDELAALGATVRLTRTSDVALVPFGTQNRHKRDLSARIATTQEFAADIYIALHANAGAAQLGGGLTFYRKDNAESRRLAAVIQDRLNLVMPGNQNGILPARYMVLTSLQIPAVLIEMGFLTSVIDKERLTRPGAAYPLAAAIAAGVLAYAAGQAAAAPVLSPFLAPAGYDADVLESVGG